MTTLLQIHDEDFDRVTLQFSLAEAIVSQTADALALDGQAQGALLGALQILRGALKLLSDSVEKA